MDKDYSKILYGLLAVFSIDKVSYFITKVIPVCSGLLQLVQLGIALATLTFIIIKIGQARQQIRYFEEKEERSKKTRRDRARRLLR